MSRSAGVTRNLCPANAPGRVMTRLIMITILSRAMHGVDTRRINTRGELGSHRKTIDRLQKLVVMPENRYSLPYFYVLVIYGLYCVFIIFYHVIYVNNTDDRGPLCVYCVFETILIFRCILAYKNLCRRQQMFFSQLHRFIAIEQWRFSNFQIII